MTEVLIIGGGVIGLSLARELCRKGVRKITILERGSDIGRESSFAAAGMLAPLTAKILADKIVENKDSKYLEIFSPRRFQSNDLQTFNRSV